MEFTELKRMLSDLEIQEDVLTDKGIQTLHELKLIFKQRDEMLEMLKEIYTERINGGDFDTDKVYKLIEQATKIEK